MTLPRGENPRVNRAAGPEPQEWPTQKAVPSAPPGRNTIAASAKDMKAWHEDVAKHGFMDIEDLEREYGIA